MDKALAYARDHREEALRDLQRLVRQPGISTQRIGMEESAALTRDLMASAGLSVEPYPIVDGSPILVGYGGGGAKRPCSSTPTTTCSRRSRWRSGVTSRSAER